jgi:hypothetical protein
MTAARMEGLNKISGCDNAHRALDVVFVHGLDGDAITTWHPKEQPDHFWPRLLGEDVPTAGIWSLGYSVSSSAWRGTTMPLSDRATNTLEELILSGIGDRSVIFICHSLGGLLVKQMLRHANDFGNSEYKRVATTTRAIIFLSTPHSGSNLADWMKHLEGILRTTVSVDELEAHHARLRELNLWYRNYSQATNIKNVVFYEKQKLGGILVVNETTADPGIAGVVPIPMDDDHVSICKPPDRNSKVYRRALQLIRETIANP